MLDFAKQDVISIDYEVMGGTPVFKGTRVPIKLLFDYLAHNRSLERFLKGFPTVSKAQALEVLNIAQEAILTLN